jgi:hypothetical protein
MPTEFVEMGNAHKLAGSTVRLAAKNFGFTMNIAYTGLFFFCSSVFSTDEFRSLADHYQSDCIDRVISH